MLCVVHRRNPLPPEITTSVASATRTRHRPSCRARRWAALIWHFTVRSARLRVRSARVRPSRRWVRSDRILCPRTVSGGRPRFLYFAFLIVEIRRRRWSTRLVQLPFDSPKRLSPDPTTPFIVRPGRCPLTYSFTSPVSPTFPTVVPSIAFSSSSTVPRSAWVPADVVDRRPLHRARTRARPRTQSGRLVSRVRPPSRWPPRGLFRPDPLTWWR